MTRNLFCQTFKWTSGEEYSYSNWAQDEPGTFLRIKKTIQICCVDLNHDNDGSGYCAYMHRYGDVSKASRHPP